MKYLYYFLFLTLLFTSCDACVFNNFVEFNLNYKRDVVVSKQTINDHIGQVIHITQEFESGVAEQIETYRTTGTVISDWEVTSVGLYYFWLELNGDTPSSFDFLESALAGCTIGGVDYAMTSLTFPDAGKTKFRISEVGTFRDRPIKNFPETFTVTLSLVPNEMVETDVSLHWSFTLEFKASIFED